MAGSLVYICNSTDKRYYSKKELEENGITDYKSVKLCLFEHMLKRGIKFYDDSYIENKDKLIGLFLNSHERNVAYNYAMNLPFNKFFFALERYRNTPPEVRIGGTLEKYIAIYGCEIVAEQKYKERSENIRNKTKDIWRNSTEYERKIRLPHTVEFHMNKYPDDPDMAKQSYDEYMKLRTEVSKNAAVNLNEVKRKDPSKRNTNIEYFLKLTDGDMEEAKRMQFERQSTNSLEKFQERFGVREGWKAWHRRQRKWQRTLNSKSDDEILEINRKRYSGTIPGNMSKSSIRVFRRLEKEFPEYTFIYGSRSDEFRIKKSSKNYFWYDCYIPEINLIIEYHGCKFHPKPMQYDFPDYREKRTKDLMKKKVALDNGYNFIEVYDDLEFCVIIDFLKEKISGYPRKRTILEEYLF